MGFDVPRGGSWDNVETPETPTGEGAFDSSKPPSEPMFIQKPSDEIFLIGKSIRIEVEVSGNPQPTVSWLKEKLSKFNSKMSYLNAKRPSFRCSEVCLGASYNILLSNYRSDGL